MEALLKQDTDNKQKIKIILALAIPAMIENLLQTLVGFVDTLFVAKLGLAEVAAVGVTNAILAVYMAIFLAFGVACSSMIAKSVGAGDMERASAVARQSVILSAVVGVLFGLVTLFFAKPILLIMGAEPDVLKEAVIYFRIVAVPAVLIALMTILGSILRSAGDTKTPMKVGLWVNLIHIVLDYVLIFGISSIGGGGIAGAAWATVAARFIGVVVLYAFLRKTKLAFSFRTKPHTNGLSMPLLKLSWPVAVERLIMRLGQVLYFGLIIRIGADVYAAHMIAGNIEIFVYMPGYGLAVAATTLVGQHLGADRQQDAYRYGLLTTGVAVVIMAIGGTLLYVLAPLTAAWFTDQTDVIEMVTTALRIVAFAMPFLAIGLVITGALQGAGDTKSPMYSTAIGMWLIRVVGVYVLGIYLQMGIAGIWLAYAIDLLIRAVYLSIRYVRMLKGERNP